MHKATFEAFASDLVERVARELPPGTRLFIALFPPGSFEGRSGPFSAGTIPVDAQPTVLRSLADSLERNAELIFTKAPT